MSYAELIKQNIQGVYTKGITTKILQHMGRIRNASDIAQARRWPMELLQNAGDLAYTEDGIRVSARFRLEEDKLIFEHTGKPFRIKDILSIINQVSSKNPGEGVGQFGTGFITTYQLSEKVEIESVIKEENLPYRKFHVTLDRSATDQKELDTAIGQSMNELQDVDNGEEIANFDKSTYNTAFIYNLENKRSHEIAEIGMHDLRHSILYIMLFSENIGKVELVENGNTITYERSEDKQIIKDSTHTMNFKETIILESGAAHYLRHITDDGITLAVEYDPTNGYLPIDERTPRLFIDFPLIGAETFPFTVVLNSRALQPNEPRSGITLVDLEQSVDAKANKRVMQAAVNLYDKFITEIIDYETANNPNRAEILGIQNIISISEFHENKEWSTSWVKQNLYKALFNCISSKKIINTKKGLTNIKDPSIDILKAKNKEELQAMIDLYSNITWHISPISDIDWYSSLKAYEIVESIGKSLYELAEKADTLYVHDYININSIAWCQKLYDICMKNPEVESAIRTGKLKIFPNQVKNDKHLYTALDLFKDNNIPEILKDVTEKLDKLVPESSSSSLPDSTKLDIRKKLLHKDFKADNLAQMSDYFESNLIDHIITRSNRTFRLNGYFSFGEIYRKAWRDAWMLMASCGPDKELYDLCKPIFENELGEYIPLNDDRFSRSLWKNSYVGLIYLIMQQIAKIKYAKNLPAAMTDEWLTDLYRISLNYCDTSSIRGYNIFINQVGELSAASALGVDKIEFEDLKTIAVALKDEESTCNILPILLRKETKVSDSFGFNAVKDSEIASKISRAVQRILSRGNLNAESEKLQEACTLLLAWLQDHPDEAKQYFPEFSTEEQQSRLLTAKAVVKFQKRASLYEKLAETAGTEDLEELSELIEWGKSAKKGELSGISIIDGSNDSNGLGGLYSLDDFEGFDDFDEDYGDIDSEWARRNLKIAKSGEYYILNKIKNALKQDGWRAILDTNASSIFYKVPDKVHDTWIWNILDSTDINILSTASTDNPHAYDTYNIICIDYPDTETYHQEGWDIKLTLIKGDIIEADGKFDIESKESDVRYIEIKTHSLTSKVRNHVYLKAKQVKLAVEVGHKYNVILADYDRFTEKAVSFTCLFNIRKLIAKGILRGTSQPWIIDSDKVFH